MSNSPAPYRGPNEYEDYSIDSFKVEKMNTGEYIDYSSYHGKLPRSCNECFIFISEHDKQWFDRFHVQRLTNLNGYTEADHYQVYGRLNDKSVLKATASDPSVKFEISKIVEGRATIKATYNGKTKIFLINWIINLPQIRGRLILSYHILDSL